MPEGHTIHRLAKVQTPLLKERVLHASSPQGRFADGAALLDGQRVKRIEPYGKHLWYHVTGGHLLHVHLGLYGKFQGGLLPAPAPRGALRLRLETDEHWLDLRGPTACDLVTPGDRLQLLARLGPDPLRPKTDPTPFVERVRRSRAPVGALLMDQSVLAGVGNVYRAEILYRHGISPFRPGHDCRDDELAALWDDLVVLMRDGVRTGRIVTTRREDRSRRTGPAKREDAHYVYRRQGLPCRVCGAEVRTQEFVGRNLFWCPHEQAR